MTQEEARTILYGYVKACREDDMLTLETFGYEDVMEAMSMGAKALQQPSLPSYVEEAAENSWVDYEYREDPRGLYSSCYIDGFKAGAGWMKDELLSKITEEHLEGLRWIIRTGITAQPRPYHKYCKDLLQLLESYKNEI